jgi:hypothetical protein
LVLSDDSEAGGEVESFADKDDHVNDLIENLPEEYAVETPEGKWGAVSICLLYNQI